MSHKIYLLCSLALCLHGIIMPTSAQQVIIQKWDGTEVSNPINSVQNLTLPNSELYLTYRDGAQELFALSDVRKIYFMDASTSNVVPAELAFTYYPNPVADVLRIAHLPEQGIQVGIYRLDGALIQSRQVSGEEAVFDLSHLASGLYLLKVQEQAVKFVKL